jgi:ankyrin repeat protein
MRLALSLIVAAVAEIDLTDLPDGTHVIYKTESTVALTPEMQAGVDRLAYASMHGLGDALRSAIADGVNVNLTYEDGFSALMYASRFGNPDCVDILVKAGAAVDAVDESGMTALMYAAMQKHNEPMARLIVNGADKTKIDKFGKTAYDYAKQYKCQACIHVLKTIQPLRDEQEEL